MTRKISSFVFTILLTWMFVIPVTALEVNEPELESVSPDAVVFINYTGPHTVIDSLEQIKKMIAQERPFVDTSCRYERTRMTVFSWRDYRDFLNNLTAIVSQHPDTIPEVIPLLKKMPAYCRIRPIAEAKAKCVKMIMYKNKNYASECLDVLFDEMRFNFDEFGRTIEIKDVLYSGINNVIHNSDSPEIAEKVLNFSSEENKSARRNRFRAPADASAFISFALFCCG